MAAVNIPSGVHEAADPTSTQVRFPGHVWAREFVADKGGGPMPSNTGVKQLLAKVQTAIQPALLSGGGCVVSLKLDMTQLARGAWDVRLTELGKALEGKQAIVILWHEPEDDLPAATFAAGFARGRKALKAGWADLVVAYCAMAYQFRPGSATTKDAQAWASVEADLWLVDVYSGVSFAPTAILPEHPGFARWYTEVIAKHPGRAWGVAERGIIAGPTRAATVAREAEWLATDPVGRTCSLFCWWATSGTEDNTGWLLDDTDARAVAALISRITIPAGYLQSPIDGVLVNTVTGILVAADHVPAFDAFLLDITN